MPDTLSFTIAAQLEAAGFREAANLVREIGTAGQEAGKKAGDGLAGVEQNLAGLSKNAEGLIAGVAGGVGVALGQAALSQIADIQTRLLEAVKTGVQFNATVESSQLGIATILRQFRPADFTSVTAAFPKAGEVIEQLKVKAVETTASFVDLVQAFTANAGAATAAGVPIEKQADLLVLASNATAGLGIRTDQLTQEYRALLTGEIDQNAQLAKTLGITREQIETQKAQGTLVTFLTTKLAAFGEAGKLAANTYAGLVSNLGDITTQLAGDVTGAAFVPIKDGLTSLSALLQDPATRAGAVELGAELGVVAKGVVDLGIEAIKARDQIGTLFKITGVGQAVTGARTLLDLTTATSREQATLTKDGQDHAASLRATVASATTAEQRDRARSLLAKELAGLERQIADARGSHEVNGQTVAYETAESRILEGTRKSVQEIADKFGSIAGTQPKIAAGAQQVADLTTEQNKAVNAQIAALNDRRLAGDTIREQESILADTLDRQVKGARERLGLLGVDAKSLASIGSANELLKLGDSLRGNAKQKTIEEAAALATVEDRLKAIRTALQTANEENEKTIRDTLAAKNKEVSEATATVLKGDRSTPEAREQFDAAAAALPRAVQAAKDAADILTRVRVENIPGLEGAYTAIQDAVNQTRKDTSEESVLTRRRLEAARKALGMIPDLLANPLVPGAVSVGLALGAGVLPPPTSTPSGYGDSAAGRAAPAPPSDTAGDTGPLSDANFEDTAQSARDLQEALKSGLGPIATALSTAAGAVPGQVAPVSAAVSTLGGAYADAFGGLAAEMGGQVDTLAGLVQTVSGQNTETARKLALLTDYVYQNV